MDSGNKDLDLIKQLQLKDFQINIGGGITFRGLFSWKFSLTEMCKFIKRMLSYLVIFLTKPNKLNDP